MLATANGILTHTVNFSFSVETFAVDVTITYKSKLRVILVYIPYSSDNEYVQRFFNKLCELTRVNYDYIIMGDLNIPTFDWERYTANTFAEKHLLEFLCKSQPFERIIPFSTRNTNILNVSLTNNTKLIKEVTKLLPDGISDHCVITSKLSLY